MEKEEGPWFRTPKSGHITDNVKRVTQRKRDTLSKYIPWIKPAVEIIGNITRRNSSEVSPYLAYATAGNDFNNFRIQSGRSPLRKRLIHVSIVVLMCITVAANIVQTSVPQVFANPDTYYMKTTTADNLTDAATDKRLQGSTTIGASTTTQTISTTNQTLYMITDNLNKRWTNDTEINDTNTTGERRNVSIATDSTGNTTAVWEDSRTTDSTQNKHTATGSLAATGRKYATATALLDGRILVTAGNNSSDSTQSSAEIYDPVTNTFSALATSLVTRRMAHSIVTLNDGRVLISGGTQDYGNALSNSEIYDPNTNTFATTANMTTGRAGFIMVKLNTGKVLALGGCTNGTCGGTVSTAELFDPLLNTWTATTGSMSLARGEVGSVLMETGEVMIAGGYTSSTYVSNVEIYNPVTNTFRGSASLSTPRRLPFMAKLLDGRIVIGGGTTTGGTGVSSTEIFDPASGTWSSLGNVPSAVAASYNNSNGVTGVVLGNGKLYVPPSNNSSTVAELFDPLTNTWTSTTSGTTAQRGLGITVPLYNGKVLVLGGIDGANGVSNSGYTYTPVTYDIYGQKYDKTGAKLWNSGTDIRVNSDDGNRVSTAGPPNYNHLNPSVALDSSGNAIVAWEEQRESIFSPTIWSQKLQSSDGIKLWPSGTKNAFTATTNNLNNIRGGDNSSATTAVLPDGRLFIVGSELTASRTTSDIFNPTTNTFSAGPNTAILRSNATTVPLLNGKILVVGGNTGNLTSTTAQLYDPVTGTYATTTGGNIHVRSAPQATLLKNGKVFITGTNLDPGAGQSVSEIYDPIGNTFSLGPVLNYNRRLHNQALLPNGKVIIIGGIATGAAPTVPEIYDPVTNTVVISAARNASKGRSTAVVLNNGKILHIGSTSSRSISEIYDPATDDFIDAGWNTKAIDRVHDAATVLPNGKVLLAGGADVSDYSSSELFDPASNTWSVGPNMSVIRRQANATYIPKSQKVLVYGGASTDATASSAEVYTPATDMQVSQFDYKGNIILKGASQGSLNPLTHKKPKVAIDTTGDVVIAWQEDKDTKSQFQGVRHNYDANARFDYGRDPSVVGNCQNGTGCAAIPAILSPSVQIAAQKICNQAACGDAGTTSGERQWGNNQNTYNANNPDNVGVATLRNAQNVNIISDGTSTAIIYDSDSGSTTDIGSNPKPDTKTRKIYAQKLDANGNAVWSGGWSAPSGGMITNRRTQTSTLLPNGTVLLAGGRNAAVLSSAEVHNPDTLTSVATTNNMTVNKINHAASLLSNGRVLITGGGTTSTTSSSTANLFTPSSTSGAFAATAGNMKISRSDQTSVLLRNGKVLLAGGRTSTTATSTAELFDPTTVTAANVFTATTNNLTAGVRYGHRATLLPNGNVVISGGTNGTGPLSSAEIYDDATGTWSSASIMVQKRSMFSLTLLPNGKILAVGGCIAGNCTAGSANRTSTAEIFDPLKNSWTSTAGSLVLGVRSEHSASLLPSGKVVIHGGTTDGTTFLSTSEIYDPLTGTFTAGSVAQTGRKDHDTISLANGKLMTVDGWNGTTAYSNAEILTIDQQISTANSTNSQNPDLVKDSLGNIQAVWQAWRSEGLSPGTSGGSWKVMTQEINNPSSGSITKQYPTGTTSAWAATGNLSTGKRNISTVLLPSGKVLASGGFTTVSVSDAEIFDPQSGTWTATANNMAKAHSNHASYLLKNGKVIVAAGSGTSSSAAEIYDPTSNTWIAGPNLTTGRSEFVTSALNNGTIMIGSGVNGAGTVVTTSEIYNPTTNTWTFSTGNMQRGHKNGSMVKLNDGKLLAVGGCLLDTVCDATSIVSNAELYDPSTGTWSLVGSLSTARYRFNANVLNNGKVLVHGGNNVSASSISSAEIFDPTTQTWTAATSSPGSVLAGTGIIGSSVVLTSGKVLSVRSNVSAQSGAYLYDPMANTWTTTGSLSKNIRSSNLIALKTGKILIPGGYDGTTNYSSSELFTPELSEKQISTESDSSNTQQTYPVISADTASGYTYVAWTDNRLTSPSDTINEENIYMQKTDGNGNPVWPNGLNENGTYNVRDVRIDTTRGSLNTTVQTKPAVAKSVFTDTATDVPVQIAWTDTRDGTPASSIYGQSYNTRNYSMSTTSWTAYYYVTGSPSSSNSISVQVGASENDGETMSYTSAASTYTGDGTNGQKSTVFSNLPPSGETSLTNRRLVMKLTQTAGSMQIQYNGSAGVADTRLDVGLIVPERSALLAVLIPLLPGMVYMHKKRKHIFRRRKDIHKQLSTGV
ncbi:MAG: hypothetical protein M3Q44_03625 [bacterium]|nr:hypothetical protein [bacterium]